MRIGNRKSLVAQRYEQQTLHNRKMSDGRMDGDRGMGPKVTHPQEDTRWQWTGPNWTGGLQDFRNGDRRWRQAGLLAHDTLWSPNEQLTKKGYGLH
ncbi:uncharacterized protein Dsimw501_GD27003 [Drosophila simulans]|uniref:Uncharacterized protein n=1 Tax=Drosophila simulans TaxID=7240 RepID=A0A0J9TG70_DROSI|nr:uncharacterized protein Dsimw501_GD27003 [Drosophila simulans]